MLCITITGTNFDDNIVINQTHASVNGDPLLPPSQVRMADPLQEVYDASPSERAVDEIKAAACHQAKWC